MARHSPAVGVAAALVAGVALWLTRATVDLVPAPGGATRVAMLPSWPELVGLMVLAFLLLVLARTLVRRVDRALLPHAAPSHRSAPSDVVVPLFTAGALALPFSPWLPDAVPALTALAGPGAVFVWTIALGHVAWVGWDVWLHRRARGWRVGGWPGMLVAGVATGALAAAAARRLAGGPLTLLRDRGPEGWLGGVSTWGPAASPGDWGAVGALALAAGLVAALQWRAAAWVTGSSTASTLAWLAIGLSAPVLLLPFAGSGTILVALLLLVGVVGLGRAADARPPVLALRSAALGLLPWLGAVHGPVSLVLACLLAWRARGVWAAMAAAVLPYLALAGGAAIAGPGLVPVVGPTGSVPAGGMASQALALLFDQEHGALLYVPALLAAGPGVWRLWRDGGASRRLVVDIVAALAMVIGAAAVVEGGWRHPYVPGAALVPVLPLMALAVARWERHVEAASVRRGLLRLLTLVGLATTASVLLVRDGGLLVANRDGIGELLAWLSPDHELARMLPALAPAGGTRAGFWIAVTCWAAALAAAGWIARRWPAEPPGRGAVIASAIALAAAIVPAVLVPRLARDHVVPAIAPAERASSPALQAFDARHRPMGVVYDPLRLVPASAVPALYAFDATPGLRRHPQPVRVLLNLRLSLPAGTYRATIHPQEGAAIRGAIGLQVGRIGSPVEAWQADGAPGRPWDATFELHVDSAFVGLRTSPELAAQVASLRIVPLGVVDATRRPSLPPVLAASQYQDVTTYFHDEHAYMEPNGFWVRGRTTLLTTLAWDPQPGAPAGVTLALHSGDISNTVRISTPAWQTTVELEPGTTREVHVPARPGQSLLQLRLSPEDGFVPAERGASDDRRVLGSWVEVLK